MQRTVWTVLLFVSGGCFFPASRGQALEKQLAQLRSEQAEMAKERVRLTQKIDAKVAEVTEALDLLDKATRRSGADTGVQLEKTVQEVAELRGLVDQYLFRIDATEQGLKKLTEDTDSKLTALSGSDAVKQAEAKRKAEEVVRPAEPAPFLALAAAKAEEGERGVARQLYFEFLKKWPKDELAGEAHFGLGETYASDEKCREALSEYGKVIQTFPKTRSAPVAYLRSSKCFRALKLGEDARLALEELVRQYPKSDAARMARAELGQLEKPKKTASPKRTPR